MLPPHLNILCVCAAGRVRSHALRMFIDDNYRSMSVIAAGVIDHRNIFLSLLVPAADVVITCSPLIEEYFFRKFSCGSFLIDIGDDVYSGPDDPALQNKIKSLSSEIELLISNTREMKTCTDKNLEIVDE